MLIRCTGPDKETRQPTEPENTELAKKVVRIPGGKKTTIWKERDFKRKLDFRKKQDLKGGSYRGMISPPIPPRGIVSVCSRVAGWGD